jgi:non-ribosomal peptide synthetase component F
MASSYLIHTIQTILGLGDGLLDLESSFVEAGGDSMKAILVASGCQQHGVAITRSQLLKAKSIQELVASFSVPLTHEDQSGQAQQDDGSSSTERDSLTPNTPPTTEIYHVIDGTPSQYDDLLLEKSPSLLPHQAPVYGVHAEAVVPQSVAAQVAENVLTEMQLSLIHGTHRNSGSNIISYTATYYAEDIQRLKSAWERVIRSESIFWGSQWALLESHYQAAFQWEEVAEERGPQPASNKLGDGVLKVCFQVSPPTHGADGRLQSRIRCSIHHAIVDGRSFHMLLDKVHQIASGLYPEMSPSFWDWSSALRQLQSAKKTEGDTFWLERQARFPDSEGNLLLANPGAVGGERSSSLVIKLGSDSHRLAASARAVGVTPALMFYAAWAMVMATYTDSDTVVFGAVLSSIHLPLPGAMSVVGPQINLLPLHVALRMDMTVETFLRSLFEDILRLDELAWTTPDNGFSRQFESALSVELPAGDSESQHLSVQPLASETEVESDVPLSVMITQCDNICIRYHRSRFHQRDVHVLADCYRNSLLSLLTTSQPIGVVLAGLVSAETDTMLKQLGNCSSGLTTRASVSDDLVTLFEQTTRACPDEVALDNGHEQLSYQALHDASGRVAAALTARNLSPGDVVGVHSDRSINWIVAIYGVLRADCVYCSMDPSIPASLRETMYSTAGAKAFLTPAKSQLAVAPKCCDVTLSVDSVLRDDDMLTRPEEKQQAMPHRVTSRPWAPAYVCFTSGSTGTPKGVLCTHEGLVAFQRNLKVRLHAKPGVRVSQTMSVAFDGSIHEIFSALSYGATLVLASGEDPLEPLGTATSAILTPSIARLLDPGDYPNLKWVRTSHFPLASLPPSFALSSISPPSNNESL